MALSSSSSRLPSAMERTGQWILSQDIQTDIIIDIGDVSFPLHKFILVAKSGYIRRKIMDSDDGRINLSEVPGGVEAFEKAAKFCYGVNFEISVHNVVVLRCAAEYLEMTERYCEGNLAGRTEEFLAQAALKTLPGAVILLQSCEDLLPMAEELQIVKRCVDTISSKACNEANFPTRIPPEWWAAELAALSPASLQKILSAMRFRAASPKSLATVVAAYAERNLPDLLPLAGAARPGTLSDTAAAADLRSPQRALLESLAALLPGVVPDDALPIGFVCCLLRAAIFLTASAACRRELERRISVALDQVTVANLLVVALDYAGKRIVDLDSVRRIVGGFVEREMGGGGGGGNYGVGAVWCSAAIQRVARIVDAFVGEIATDKDLTVHKFASIAGALPKSARRFDDDLYRAVDIYLKAHPGLHEIEREKLCSVMDPLKLTYDARLHASQNNRLPLQIVLQALYYDQLKLRSGAEPENAVTPPNSAAAARAGAMADASLMRENEALRSELTRMKLCLSELQRSQGTSGLKAGPKRPTFFSSFSKTLEKLNPFRHGSKDTASIDDGVGVDLTKPRRRRFSIG
ncbi:root phototropism protein 2 [Elaeis guineensis]|uniref:Root phototropism protein 2 n=1 Tax=Elaeis guineensis var. tenera TaxID=51953 RepID=A0A6I9RGB3_ELAGV|nr:root phototropism protein 2 [Elaeis guineensis]